MREINANFQLDLSLIPKVSRNLVSNIPRSKMLAAKHSDKVVLK